MIWNIYILEHQFEQGTTTLVQMEFCVSNNSITQSGCWLLPYMQQHGTIFTTLSSLEFNTGSFSYAYSATYNRYCKFKIVHTQLPVLWIHQV